MMARWAGIFWEMSVHFAPRFPRIGAANHPLVNRPPVGESTDLIDLADTAKDADHDEKKGRNAVASRTISDLVSALLSARWQVLLEGSPMDHHVGALRNFTIVRW